MPGSFRSKVFRFSTLVAIFALCFLGGIQSAHAQALKVSPTAGTYNAGQTFSVRVLVSSPNEAVNAVSGTLSFSKDKLQVLSVSKTGSVMSLWVQEPSFSNAAGTVDFAGVILNPGFSGDSATVVTVNFRATAQGQADVGFTSGSLLANDGAGTNVLKTLGTGSYKIDKAAPVTAPEKVTTTPVVPAVASLKAPTITDYKKQVKGTESVYVIGSTEPNFKARLYVLDADGHPVKVAEDQSDSDGSFALRWNPSSDDMGDVSATGVHNMVVYAISPSGLVTPPSEKLQVIIDREAAFFVGQKFLNILLIALAIILVLVFIMYLVLHTLRKSGSFKAELYREMQGAEARVHKAFDKVRDDLEKYIEILEKADKSRTLTEEEKKLSKMLNQSLSAAEKAIEADVTRLEKKVRR